MRSIFTLFVLILCSLTLAACLPNRFVIDLAGSDGKLMEKEVFSSAGPASGSKIAMIDVEGLISHVSTGGVFVGSGNAVDDLVARLDKAEKDPTVRAVLLRVNSPGGTVAASESIYNELRAFRERTKKPIVVSMAEMAASGGYYISLAADRVIAQPSSITGSIGVIIQTMNFSKGMAMIGVESRAVKSGPNKDLANPFEAIREDQYAVLQGTVDDFYASFRALVRERRPGIDPATFDTVTDGRIFTGRQALDAGLVDSLGDLRASFETAESLAGIEHAALVKYHIEGRAPASPFASAQAPDSPVQRSDLNLSLHLPGVMSLSPGFYYLWSPELP